MAKTKKKYAIIDIETTGGMTQRDKITEIGVVIHDGEKVVEKWDTLVNPERSIPMNISRITGITNDMVIDAPKFYEVAKKLIEITENCIFVAHNVRFDYGFIRKEFNRLGYTYSRKQLCSVKLSRKVFPSLSSYSLGNLIRHFNISVSDRHRALADAEATAVLFDRILEQQAGLDTINDIINYGIRESRLPTGITIELLSELPESTGVYYMHNSYGEVVYVGKSKNIKKRIIQHFQKVTKKNEDMLRLVKSISYEETGSELIALLLESKEIKGLSPLLNKAQRTKSYPYFIYTFLDLSGILNFAIQKTNKKNVAGKEILNYFGTRQAAKSRMNQVAKEYELCDHYAGFSVANGDACFAYATERCAGICLSQEETDLYNERAIIAKSMLNNVFDKDFFIVTEGRNNEEKGLVLVQEGHYRGFGYIQANDLELGIEECLEAIDYRAPNPETNLLVRTFLSKSKYQIIEIGAA